MHGAPRIQLTNLRKRYGEKVALEDLSLEVRAGEIFGLIGPDGAGKTTAMRIACALLRPDGGEARIMGFDTVREGRRVKERIGYMPQRFSLYPDLSVAENLRFFADLFQVSGTERRRREERLMEFSALGSFRSRRAGRLSGGMKQKLALCCTLIHTPDVLVLDEPTTGVDVVSRQEFWNILSELAAEKIALLVSTPYMDEAALFQRVALMHGGRAIAAGPPEEVTARFHRRLLEVRGAGTIEAWRRLSASDTPQVEVHRFGDRLHVMYDKEEKETFLRSRIGQLDIEIRRIEPTIEDTFVDLIRRGGGGVG